MLNGAGARGRTALGLLVSLLVVVGLTLAGASAADADDPSPKLSGLPHGVTVSWPPTSKPVEIVPGTTSHATFWVTNDTDRAVPITIKPATAVPGDDGALGVSSGADSRFPSITLTPSRFVAAAGSTTLVKETVVSPSDLPPGVYLLPAVVQPHDRYGRGNVRIRRSLVGLTTFQVPGDVEIDLTATLMHTDPPPGTLTRKLPGLPLIEVGRAAGATLQVSSQSTSGFYAYYEVTGTTRGLGSLTFDGHAAGIPTDLRGDQSLYFPDTHRDFPITWRSSSFEAAEQTLTANVSFSSSPSQLRSVTTVQTLVVISPWWIAVGVLVLLLVAVASMRRTVRMLRSHSRRQRRRVEVSRARRTPAVLGGAVLVIVAVTAGALSMFWVLAATVALAAAGLILQCRGADPARMLRRLMTLHVATLAALALAAALLVASFVRHLSPGYSFGVLSGAACLLLSLAVVRAWIGTRVSTPADHPPAPSAV